MMTLLHVLLSMTVESYENLPTFDDRQYTYRTVVQCDGNKNKNVKPCSSHK